MHLRYLFTTSVGKKLLVGLTGVGLAGFVLMHMSSNMLILVGAEAYNRYSHALVTNPFIYLAEGGLLLVFLVHVYYAILLARENRTARPVSPAMSAKCGKDTPRLGSRSMIYSGLLVFVFLVLHLWTFKFGAHYTATYGGVEMRDLHRLVIEKFSQPLYFAWYLFALLILGLHLSHGASAVVQSLGLGSVRNPRVKKAGWAFAVLIAGGFISQPLWVMLCGGK